MSDASSESIALRHYREQVALACLRPVVHDANNALGAISLNAELILGPSGEPSPTAPSSTRQIASMALECSRLLETLVRMVRPMANHTVPLDAAQELRDATALYQHNLVRTGLQIGDPTIATDRKALGYPGVVRAVLAGGIIRVASGLEGRTGGTLRGSVDTTDGRVVIELLHPKLATEPEASPTDPSLVTEAVEELGMLLVVTPELLRLSLEAAP